jgi:hypothetical protein
MIKININEGSATQRKNKKSGPAPNAFNLSEKGRYKKCALYSFLAINFHIRRQKNKRGVNNTKKGIPFFYIEDRPLRHEALRQVGFEPTNFPS